MEDRYRDDRLELEQEVVAPRDVRRQRREEVDEPDDARDGRGDSRQTLRPPDLPQRRRPAVQSEPPRVRVALRRGDVAPVP
jgi:hypothetical protein